MLNGLAPRPGRRWTNSTGDPIAHRIEIADINKIGIDNIRSAIAKNKSKALFTC
jgi:hypothetical protein|tara:strand:- start:7260 stop:7421 length:162 start_codon:yes stop_codon:yes gene_type:complete